jgi:hypothetical protein
MMKTAYLVRYGAYGDHIHMSNVVKALDEEDYDLTVEYNLKGAQIHARNPRIDHHVMFEPYHSVKSEKDKEDWLDRLDQKKNDSDLFVNFTNSLEDTLIEPEKKSSYFWPLWMRREKNTKICYYDQSMIWAGLTGKKYMGWTGEIYFNVNEHKHVWDQLHPYRDKFIILWAMRGTMWQKAVCHIAKDIINDWLRENPDSVVITTGDDFCQKWEWISEIGATIAPEKGLGDGSATLIHKSGRMPFRQALHIADYVDLIVTPETGLGIGAGAFGTPKIMLMTAASLKNIVGNDKNDYSIQSDAWCSPCTRAIYNTNHCTLNSDTNLPICVDFRKEDILSKMREAKENHGRYNIEKRNHEVEWQELLT